MHQPQGRIATLDVIRGAAVMGILLANIVAFGLPEAAYFSPLAWGGHEGADRLAWFLNFVFVEGRMRGLFSFLFGASMLLVIDRADAAGGSGAAVHLRRMVWLFVIGCLHLYLLWWGDILAHYALVGVVALLFHRAGTRALVLLGLASMTISIVMAAGVSAALFASAARSTATQVATWDAFAYAFGVPPPAHLAAEAAALGGGFARGVAWRWREALDPFTFFLIGWPETLSAMLLGMAGLRSGFLTGAWTRRAYRGVALVCVPLSLLGYAAIAANTMAHGFDQRWVQLGALVVSAPFRVLGYVGYAALLVMALDPAGASGRRVAAAGRMALSNYLATTVVMDLVFAGWGLGLFGQLSRATLYVFVPPMWLAMLLWSPWWLRRHHHGPVEWLWRSLVQGAPQPIRTRAATS